MQISKMILVPAALAILASCAFKTPTAAYKTVDFWDFNRSPADAVRGGSSWSLTNVDYGDSTIMLDGVYEYSGKANPERAVVATDALVRDSFTIGMEVSPDAAGCPLLMGGTDYRWLGLWLDSDSTLSVGFNNWTTVYTSKSTVSTGAMHVILVSVDVAGLSASLYVDDNPVETFALPAGFAWNFTAGSATADDMLTVQDYSTGGAFKGQIDWVYVSNTLLNKADATAAVAEMR